MLWPPVRVNADGSEHRCQVSRPKRAFRVVEPVPPSVQAALANERAAGETTAAVQRLADVLADAERARTDYYRQRAGAGRPAPRSEVRQEHAPAQGAVTNPPAATYERSLLEEIDLDAPPDQPRSVSA